MTKKEDHRYGLEIKEMYREIKHLWISVGIIAITIVMTLFKGAI